MTDYREFLVQKFDARRAADPTFSLRRFASVIGLTPSNLSDVLKGRCGLSSEVALKIADKLQLNDFESQLFNDLVEMKHARSKADRDAAVRRLRERERVPFVPAAGLEMSVAERWYFPAIIELLTVRNGVYDEADFAAALRLSPEDVRSGVRRLLDGGLLVREGQLIHRSKSVVFQSQTPNEMIQNFHRQMLGRAAEALQDPIDQRRFASTTMTFDSRRLAEAVRLLENFEDEHFARFEAKANADSVYCLSYQFFRVDAAAAQTSADVEGSRA